MPKQTKHAVHRPNALIDENRENAWRQLLKDVLSEFGEAGPSSDSQNWHTIWPPYAKRLTNLAHQEVAASTQLLGPHHSKPLRWLTSGWDRPGFAIALSTLDVDPAHYIRPSPEFRLPDKEGFLRIDFELLQSRPSDSPGYFLLPIVIVKLHVSYGFCEVFSWVIRNWRRLLQQLLLPHKPDRWLNQESLSQLKGFRGTDRVREIELYLQTPGSDPSFDLHCIFTERNVSQIAPWVSAVVAVFDAMLAMTAHRCDPDRLLKHWLNLRNNLPSDSFRGGYFGQISYIFEKC